MRLPCFLLAAAAFAAEHKLDATPGNIAWGHYSAGTKPVLRVRPGDTVAIRTVSGNPARLEQAGLAGGQIQPELRAVYEQVKDRGPGGHLLTGPIYIEEAEPGDVLEVRILEITLPVDYAYTVFRPGAGFLPDDFPYYRMKVVPLDREKNVARFGEGVNVPLAPFFGSMGVAPPEANGRIDSAPPWMHAGNLDNKRLVAGTKLLIPVHVKGALFQAGDGHAAQGDGEVCITALETSLDGRFQFVVHKNKRLRWPRAETPTHYIAMGLHPDLTEATRLAVREAIDFLMTEKGISRDDAYMLTSVAVDLAITQLVDGTKGVHAMIPKSLFAK
ncbi:MAG: acetamidase/formamidase family protein [Bryobacteraceae bacterium]|nr:acetamidase/formamidase family protein [Bryobacteraceae bacterium]